MATNLDHPATVAHWYSCQECRHSNIAGENLTTETGVHCLKPHPVMMANTRKFEVTNRETDEQAWVTIACGDKESALAKVLADDLLARGWRYHHRDISVEEAEVVSGVPLIPDLLQENTAMVYVGAFLEWIRQQNSIARGEGHLGHGDQPVVIIPAEPTDEDIADLINGFIELDYRFGN